MAVVSMYYRIRRLGISLTPAGSSRVVNSAFAVLIIAVIAGAALSVNYFLLDKRDVHLEKGTITFTIGDVEIIHPGKAPQAAQIKDTITKGVIIKTGDKSQLTLQVENDAIVKIQANSMVKVDSLFEEGEARLSLDKGAVLSKLKRLLKGMGYRIKTSNATASVRGTEFSISCMPNRSVISVRGGRVQIRHLNIETQHQIAEKDVNEGNTAIVTEKLEIRTISKIESLEVEKVSIVSFIADIDKKSISELERIGREQFRKEQEIEKKIIELKKKKSEKSLMTLDDIKTKYGRVDEVTLYSGRVIKS